MLSVCSAVRAEVAEMGRTLGPPPFVTSVTRQGGHGHGDAEGATFSRACRICSWTSPRHQSSSPLLYDIPSLLPSYCLSFLTAILTMPAATPAKRVLAETTSTRNNIQASPRSAKKLKLDRTVINKGRLPVKQANGSFNSSQPKSQFEEEVLEKMTQEMENLKQNNTERDQQWSRPRLEDWDPTTQNLCFQQIEAEEGALNGGRTTVKLFGITDVSMIL